MTGDKSKILFEEAKKYMPGGVNSPVRAMRQVGLDPVFMEKGRGALIYDADGSEYIDYVCAWGPLVLGHLHPDVTDALHVCLEYGTGFGAPTELENILASMIVEAVPSMEMVRLVNSGTEAAMSAARLARAYTGRSRIVKFEGCYHGHADTFLIGAGSGALTHGVPTSPGVPIETAGLTINALYNDLGRVEEIFGSIGDDVAGIIVEPVAGNMGVVPPVPGFLEGLREITSRYGALLIFDEVITGFRVAYGGAQELYGIDPDITCLGKIIGGGLPVGAYGGKKDVMSMVSPEGPVYQAGTMAGNPLAVTAGIATLQVLQQEGVYGDLDRKTGRLQDGIRHAAARAGVELRVNRVGSMMTAFFTGKDVHDYETALGADTGAYARFFRNMLENGVYLAPSQYETMFVSAAHTDELVDITVEAAGKAFGI